MIQQCPQIPVWGRLRFFLENWKKITDDQWVLSLIEEGYKLEFIQKPPQSGMKETIVPRKNLDILNAEVAELLRKDAIEKVPPNERGCGFYSTFFLVPKKNGKMRPVINLRPLNRYLKKEHFKMDTLKKVIYLVKPNDWAISLDLSDAYLHIPIFQKHRKYLRFCIAGQCWQWKCLCFGPSTAPRVFSKVISVIAAHLRAQNIRLASYLDDWLALNQLKRLLLQDREKCLNLLVALGFIINKEKSELIPKQEIVYIGGAFHLKLGIVTPTPERLRKLDLAIQRLLSGQNQARDFLHLLGLMASCLELIPNGRLFMRPIQLHLLAFWRPASMDLEVVVPITQHLKSHLRWWSDLANTMKGRSLQQAHTQITIATDASKHGYGGHVGKDFIQGTWSKSQSELHINLLELEAVFLTVKHFLPVLKNKNVLIRSDSTTVCQCESTGRHKVATSVLQNLGFVEFCTRKQHASKSSAHIGSSEHLRRPIKSRESTTYRMANAQSSSTNTVSDLGDTPDRPICIQGEQTDSSLLFLDSTPRCIGNRCSVSLLGRNVCICVPSNMSHTQSSATYGAVSLSDYSHCTKMASQALVPRPSKIPDSMSKETTSVARPVTTAQNNDQSSKSRSIQSACLATINRSFQEKGFSNQSRKLISASWRSGTQQDYTGKFNKFCSWCSTRQIDPYSASLVQVADFLTDLFNNGLQYRTIAGYRSMLSAVLQPINNTPVGQHPYIIRLLKGVFNSRPPKVKILPEWDLQLVLNMLQKQPFEPLSKASLKHITFKLIFLMAISTFRRCNDLQSLKIGKGSVCVQKKGITFIRHGLAKQDRESHFGSKIFVPAFEENYRLDPKRALYWYLKKTQLLRVSSDGTVERKIFLALNKPHQAVSTQTISNWIVQTIRMAYDDQKLKVKAHSTRAIGPSWALYKGASMKSILDAADWSKESTFTQFYLRKLDVEVLKQ